MHILRWVQTILVMVVVALTVGGRLLAEDAKRFPDATVTHAGPAAPSSGWYGQHFVCDTGYTQARCHDQMVMLARQLDRFQENVPAEWTWVLVRQDDWREVITKVGLDPHTPAFSTLSRRETFLDEALFSPNAVNAADLVRSFSTPLNQMLELAVSHELGHAFCMDRRELQANRFSDELRKTGAGRCAPDAHPASRNTMSTLPVPR